MRLHSIAAMLIAGFFALNLYGQPTRVEADHQKQIELNERTAKIKEIINRDFKNAHARPDFPMVPFRLPGAPSDQRPQIASADSTPPTSPANLEVVLESIHSVFVKWAASADLESGIDYYAYGIGSEAGAADIRWWQTVGMNTSTYSASLVELGFAEGDTFYISVYAMNGAGLSSDVAATPPIIFHWEDLGNPSNELTIGFADYGYDSTGVNLIAGWNAEELATLQHFVSRMNPIIKEIYGPPSHDYTVTLVKNLWYSGSNVFLPSSNEVHMSDIYPQLLTHELLHAYHDNVIFSTDDYWQFHPRLSGFEESFAQGASYICMNRYVELYPDDAIVDSTSLFGSTMDWDYDFRNVDAITTEDFWSDYGALGLYWERYELGAAAARKIHLEKESFFRDFNAEYYARLNADHHLTTSRDLLIDIAAAMVPEVEMQSTAEWIAGQRIFDCEIKPGRKVWIRTQHYPWMEFIIFQRIFYYDTFPNGSDWAYWDNGLGQWIYHSLNGSSGAARVSTYSDSTIWQGELLIEPGDNPPDFFGFGNDVLNFSTDDDVQPWPGGEAADFVFGMLGLNLYRFDVSFGDAEMQVVRLMGNELRNTTGILGGIQNAKDGVVYIDHENFPAEPPLQVRDGAFWGARLWASAPNQKTGGTDSQPGRVSIRFVQNDGVEFRAQRNIDWGSSSGNQAFLFDTRKMIVDSSGVTSVASYKSPAKFVVQQNYPNPFNPSTEIRYTLPRPSDVEIEIFNILGQRIKTLLDERQPAGTYKIVWDAKDDFGQAVGSGVYFYRVTAGRESAVKKMILVR
jgi:hypothetical protein